jgi:flagellar motor component MotA
MTNSIFIFLGGMIAGTYALIAYDETSIVRLIVGAVMALITIMSGRVFSDAVDTIRTVRREIREYDERESLRRR